ncbi:MAG: DUF3748 domain-containing protein [Verrucomicrobiales bacterium]|nr:DUF3748 domain-containing protein [Verrucomicrobiales bacterium]
MAVETQVTSGPSGRILTNTGVWSPDGDWIVYDVRSDPAGSVFDGTRIERVNVRTREVEVLYESRDGACCGVATYHPLRDRVVFIHGPEHPTADWSYAAAHRRGVWVDVGNAGVAVNLDARDLTSPFTPGALRGGSHVHVYSPDGGMLSFTYEDDVLGRFAEAGPDHDLNQRNVGVSVPCGPVRVSPDHPRNHSGEWFTVLVTRTTSQPRPGSDDIIRACEEGWVGTNGYVRPDGTRQQRALAFQGTVLTQDGRDVAEVFLVDLPDDLTRPGDGALAGTETRMPWPPGGVVQRRLTFTTDRKHPGIQGPRHWLRCSPDGSQIAYLAKDHDGVVQLWTVPPHGGAPRQVTRNPWSIASGFTWSPDGRWIAHVMDGSVFVTDAVSGVGRRLTPRAKAEADRPRPEACVFSPDGRRIAYVRQVPDAGARHNQIFVVTLDKAPGS